MSDIKWSTVECKGVENGGTAGSSAITDGIANAFGLSFEKSITISDGDTIRLYKIRSLINCYIGFACYSTGISAVRETGLYFKLQNENFVRFSGIANVNSGLICELTDSDGVYCKRAEFCGYNFRVMRPMRQGSMICMGFTTGKFTDYFSGKTHDVVMTADSDGFVYRYIYNEDDDNYTSLNVILVGGSIYPTVNQNIAVATPVMFGNDKYYGYIGNSSSLYELFGNYTKPGPITTAELGMQATINGTSFRLIGKENTNGSLIFIRSS